MNDQRNDRLPGGLRRLYSRRTALARVAAAGAVAAFAAPLSHRVSASATQLGALMTDATPAATPAAAAPTAVLVHGAFADASSWTGVIKLLQAASIPTIAIANPLRGIALDGEYAAGVISAIPGPVLLVGHSYGGAVITAAGTKTPNALGLVYVAAFAPDEGETLLDVLGKFPPTLLGPGLRPTTASTTDVELIIDPAQVHDIFAGDLSAEQIAIIAVTQRPVAASSLSEKAPAPAWKHLPSWFAVAKGDHAIGADAERFYAKRAGSITVEIDASHVVMISQPQAIFDLISTALGSLA